MIASREVRPERLDRLPPDDPLARGSRRDLARLNGIMRNAAIVADLLPKKGIGSLLEIGCGDGGTMLRVARRLAPRISGVHLVLVDRQPLLTDARRTEFEALGWTVESVAIDVFDFFVASETRCFDAIVANLFLHHFDDEPLAELLRLAAQRSDRFVACEPERSGAGLLGCRLMPLIGCNEVTLHDARVSVLAGFRGREIAARWPKDPGWRLDERAAFPFSHAFRAERTR